MDDIAYERVEIATWSPFVLTDHGQGRAAAVLKAELYRPATLAPPFPAVVVSEGLGGVKTARERRYGRFLAQNGFAALVVDSFATRGYAQSRHPIRAINVTESMMVADAFAGLSWLAARPDVDRNRIANIGFSYGGMVTVLTAYEQLRALFVPTPDRFAAHVSYYGPTVPRLEDYRTTGAPVAILNGALDKNFSPKRLELIAQDLREGGSAVENIVFEEAYHQWDSDDHERRWDPFNIAGLGTRITPERLILDERSGRVVAGFASRLWTLARGVSLAGYSLKRDADVMQRTDEILLRYLRADAAAGPDVRHAEDPQSPPTADADPHDVAPDETATERSTA